jgi:WD40 repeat protein
MLAFTHSQSRIVVAQCTTENEHLEQLGEFSRNNRLCTVVRWSNCVDNVLAAGFDRLRGDSGLIVWDVSRITEGNEHVSVLSQYGSSQGVTSAAWLAKSSVLLAGMGMKWIKGYDTRANLESIFTLNTKAVLGLRCDPFSSHRFASFGDDSIVKVWDTRYLNGAVLNINTEFRFGVASVAWSPTVPNLLSSSGKDGSIIKIWRLESLVGDFTNEQGNTEDDELLAISHFRIVNSPEIINHFRWLANVKDHSIVVSAGKDSKVLMLSIPALKLSKWDSRGSLIVSDSKKLVEYSQMGNMADISEIMYQRALDGYSIKVCVFELGKQF